MTDIDRAAIRARIEHCKAYRFGMLGVIAGQDAPALLAALEDAERENAELRVSVQKMHRRAQVAESAMYRWETRAAQVGTIENVLAYLDSISADEGIRGIVAERDALAAENREALRRIENTLEVIGDPQHPRHRGETYSDLADRLLPVLDPAYDTDEEIDADPIIRGVNRYETRTMAKLAAAQVERDALAAVVEQAHDSCPECAGNGMVMSFGGPTDCPSLDMHRILATAPTVALEAVKAEAWDEGLMHAEGIARSQSGESADVAADVVGDLGPSDNPYRKTNTKESTK